MQPNDGLSSAPRLYAQAFGFDPALKAKDVAEASAVCAQCGSDIQPGQPVTRVTIGSRGTFHPGFPLSHKLADRSSPYVCGSCSLFGGIAGLTFLGKTVACREGVFSIASTAAAGSFVLNPPKPPFAAVYSTRKSQHIIWRATVSLDRDHFFVVLDGETLVINRPAVRAATEAYLAIKEALKTIKHPRTGKPLKGEPLLGSVKLGGSVGRIRDDVTDALTEAGRLDLLEPFADLTVGDWWAIACTRFIDDLDNPPPLVAVDPDKARNLL